MPTPRPPSTLWVPSCVAPLPHSSDSGGARAPPPLAAGLTRGVWGLSLSPSRCPPQPSSTGRRWTRLRGAHPWADPPPPRGC